MRKVFKKAISVLLVAVIVFGAAPLSSSVGLELLNLFNLNAKAETSGYYTYTVYNGNATITDCTTSVSGDITIPSTLGGYPVKSIGPAFEDCINLTSVTIPNGVTRIGENAFYSCSSLKSVSIPDSVTSIDDYAFCGCESLTDIIIPDSVAYIGSHAFANCDSLKSIEIPGSVEELSFNAFLDCDTLESVTICNGVKSIGSQAFDRCYSLKNVTIPDSVTIINDGAFRFCESLTSIIIPDSVTSIENMAFGYCERLTNITIGKGVTNIDICAFYCENLSDVYYVGSKAEWNAISIGSDNESLLNAKIHFNSTPGGETPVPVYYDVTWNANGGLWSDGYTRKVVTTKAGNAITAPANPEKNGYEFAGWTPVIPKIMPSSDLTFTAIWQETETPSTEEDITKQKYIDEHVKFAKSSTFVNFKDENLANQFSEVIRDNFEYHWNNALSLNFFTNYYDVVVAQVLSSEEMHSAFIDVINSHLASNVRSAASDFIASLDTLDGTTGLDKVELFEMFTAKDLSAYKNTATYQSLLEVFGKNSDDILAKIFKGTDYLNRGFSLVQTATDVVEGFVDCIYYKSAIDAYKESNEYFRLVLTMVANSDIDSGLKKAIKNFTDTNNDEDYIAYADSLYDNWRSVSARKGLKIACDLFAGKIISGTASFILNIPLKGGATLGAKAVEVTCSAGKTVTVTAAQVASGVISGVTLGMTVSSLIANSGDFGYNAASCAHAGDFANAVWPILTKLEQQLTGDPTFENALLFENAFILYREIQLCSLENMINVANSKNDSFIYWVFNKSEDIAVFVARETEFKNLKCHASNFDDLLAGEYEEAKSSGYKVNVTACPVDVYVYDSLGNLVASVVDDYAECFDNRIAVYVINSVKYFGLPTDEDYSIRIVAKDNGEMNYSIFEFDGNLNIIRKVLKNSIILKNEKEFSGKIDCNLNTNEQNYNLSTNENEVIGINNSIEWVNTEKVSISIDTLSMTVGDSKKISAQVYPENATDKTVRWVSSDESIVKISDTGVIIAVDVGTALITAIGEGFCYDECVVTVEEAIINANQCGDNLSWTFDKETGTLEISGTGAMWDWQDSNETPWYTYRKNIKAVIIGDNVTSVGNYAFFNCINLANLTIGKQVSAIGDFSFGWCESLTNVTIPDSVITIGVDAFWDCANLTSAIIGNSVTTIGKSAFYNCENLTRIIIPDGVTTIGEKAFMCCRKLADVTLPESVTTIGESAFAACEQFTSISIPKSVTSLGDGAFGSCISLTNVTIPEGITSLGNWTFSVCNNLTEITIPKSVTSIGEGTFNACSKLKKVMLHNNITRIGEFAFAYCHKLTNINIPYSVKIIEKDAFFDCTNLTKIEVDMANMYYSSDAYGVLFNKDKTELVQYPIGNARASYIIPNGVTKILERSFAYCENLTSLTMNANMTTISEGAFINCDNLSSITIPSSVTTIGDGAFSNCDSLEYVYYSDTEEQWKKISIGLYNEDLIGANIHYKNIVDEAVVTTPSKSTINYGDSIMLHIDIDKIPEDGYISWTVSNDNFDYSVSADGTTCTITPSKSGNTTFTATIYDAQGNAVSKDEQIMTSKAGFFQKIIAFFKKLFGLTKTIPQIYKGIF